VKRVSIFLISTALIAGMVGCGDGGGGGPFQPSQNLEIRTWYDLDDVRDNLAGNHTLMNDLDSTTLGYEELASPTAHGGKGWEPIGIFIPERGGGFWGTFDGQGYEIRDLFINRPDEELVGLFGSVEGYWEGAEVIGGTIKDVGVINVTVVGEVMVGGLVGWNDGIVSNSYSTGSVVGDSRVGGLMGNNGGTVSDSYSTSSVTGSNFVGGLAGIAHNVSNCYATGDVTGDEVVGGLVGWHTGGTVSYSYATGNVTGSSSVGGLVGDNDGEGAVSDSFWDIETSGRSTSDGGTGKNTAEMQDIATFSGAGWNIIEVALNQTNPAYIWNIPITPPDYPFLSWQPV